MLYSEVDFPAYPVAESIGIMQATSAAGSMAKLV
jgi:hypothetical protein